LFVVSLGSSSAAAPGINAVNTAARKAGSRAMRGIAKSIGKAFKD